MAGRSDNPPFVPAILQPKKKEKKEKKDTSAIEIDHFSETHILQVACASACIGYLT